MAKADKAPKTKARGKVSKLDKAMRKLNGTSAKTPFTLKSGQFTVTSYAIQPTEVPGYLIDRSDTHVVYRHKKTSASKQMVVSVFPIKQVLGLLGGKEGGSITVPQRRAFNSVTGTLKFEGSTVAVTDEHGVVTYIDLSSGDHDIRAADAEGSQASGRGAKASDEGKKKKASVTPIKEGKKKKK